MEKILEFINHNSVIITCGVTLIGLYFNNRNLRKSFENDFYKIHRENYLNEMKGLSLELVDLMQSIMEISTHKLPVDEAIDKFIKIENKIIAFGSAKAIDVCCYAQQNIYKKDDPMKTIAALSLLICQLRYDLSGEVLSYESWTRMRIKDYFTSSMENSLYENAKEIVKLYQLNENFLRKIPY